jgi:hypothetical protein
MGPGRSPGGRSAAEATGSGPVVIPLGVGLTVEALVLAALRRSHHLAFAPFAFSDVGANLSMPDLVAPGYRPTRDFGYIYGLLPLSILRIWLGLFGATPTAVVSLAIVCQMTTAWSLARFAARLRAGAAGMALVMAALPNIVGPHQLFLIHSLEPALLVYALAEQARGKPGLALALVTACAVAKPSMAYVYGLGLLVFIVARARGLVGILRALGPAAMTELVLIVLLAGFFGLAPLRHTLLPSKANQLGLGDARRAATARLLRSAAAGDLARVRESADRL